MWHSMPRANGDTLRRSPTRSTRRSRDVKVNLVNQVDYEDTFTKYKAGLSSGDLPDIVQLQGDDQQQMIDTQTVLPASVCAKADKYSFSDFLPRVVSYFTVEGTHVRDAVQHVGSGALLQQEGVHARPGSIPRSRRRRSTRCAPPPRSSRAAVP